MYYASVFLLMFALPLLSVALQADEMTTSSLMPLLCKWFVFWSVGARLLLAGFRQVFQPSYTAHVILGLKDNESLLLVRELGFANLSMAALGLASFEVPSWRLAIALCASIFYALAGINHAFQQHRNPQQHVAMASDIFVALILIAVCVHALANRSIAQ